MRKALTVHRLNEMFQEKQDVFEYPFEKADWKFPNYVKVEDFK